MEQKIKIIKLFNIYTCLSIGISLLGWSIVNLGFVQVPESITSQIGLIEIVITILVYGFGLINVWSLARTTELNRVMFFSYIGSQILALTFAFFKQGWLFFPAAGSQGTIPALVITVAMFVFLMKKSNRTYSSIS